MEYCEDARADLAKQLHNASITRHTITMDDTGASKAVRLLNDYSELMAKAADALASIPTPTAGRAEALEAAAKVCEDQLKHYAGGYARLLKLCAADIRALSSAPTHQAVTVDDAAVERAAKVMVQRQRERGVYKPSVVWDDVHAALAAAFPQRREE